MEILLHSTMSFVRATMKTTQVSFRQWIPFLCCCCIEQITPAPWKSKPHENRPPIPKSVLLKLKSKKKKSPLTLVPSFSGNMRAVFCNCTMAQFAFIMVVVLTQLYFIHRLPQITDEINHSCIPRRQHQKLKWVLTSMRGYLKSQKFHWSMWVHTHIIIRTPFEELLGSTSEYTSIIKTLFEELSGYNRDIRKVKETQHQYPEFGHKGVRLKNTVKRYTAINNRVKLRLLLNFQPVFFFSWVPSLLHVLLL